MATYTVQQSGGDFTTLAAALSDAGTVANDTISIAGTWSSADTSPATVSDDNITITVASAAAHPGYVSNSDHYRLEDATGSYGIQVSNTGCSIDGVVIKVDNTGASNEAIRMAAASGTLTVKNSILYSLNGATTNDQDGVHASTISCTVNLENTQAYGFSRAGFCAQPFTSTHTQTWNINSCKCWDNGQDDNDGDCGGVATKVGASSTVNFNIFNTVSMNNATAATGTGGTSQSGDFNDEGTGTTNWNIDYCISSDATITARDSGAVGSLEDHNLTDDNTKASDGDWVIVEDITSSPYDLRLQSNSFNEAQDMHSSSTGAGLTIPSTDCIGTSRPQNTNYDCGDFEIASGSYTLVTASGSFTLTGTSAGLTAGRSIGASSGSYSLSGTTVALNHGFYLATGSGTYSLSGTAASLLAARAVSAASGSFLLSGTAVALDYGYYLATDSGSYALTGTDITLTYTPVGNYTLTTDSGSFTLTGTSVSLTVDRTLTAGSGSYALTGTAVALNRGYYVSVDSGSFTLTGSTAGVLKGSKIALGSGSYAYSGTSINLSYQQAVGSAYYSLNSYADPISAYSVGRKIQIYSNSEKITVH